MALSIKEIQGIDMAGSEAATEERQLDECAALLPSDPAAAALQLQELLKENPLNADAYRLLSKAKVAIDRNSASAGKVLSTTVSAAHGRLAQAEQALRAGDLPPAEIILRARLLDQPADAQAVRMMGDLAMRLSLDDGAEQLFRYAIELAPDFGAAKLDLAKLIHLQNRNNEALAIVDEVLAREPENENALYMKAVLLGHAGRFEETVAIYEWLIQRTPGRARLWASYGRSLKTIGRSQESVEALRRAAQIDPSLGEAWWSLSDLKTVRLDRADIETMETVLQQGDLTEKDRYYLHFALGKAFEDQRDFANSFQHYAEGNRLRRQVIAHDPNRFSNHVSASRQAFSAEYFDARKGVGCDAGDPIFILGMSRAGSTLIEQILASHPSIEGTMELPNMLGIARGLADEFEDRVSAIASLQPERCAELGERYLRETSAYRKTKKPYFIDKMPSNWLYVPLIHLTLPNARIIDARRHPLACCFSNFKQNYARGQAFSYDLSDLGKYYSDYVRMMAQMDEVLPGKVHRVFHEDLVDNTEEEVRRLLDYLGLPFDEQCLRFYENERAVRTASAEQVRRPINRQGVDQWREYEPWLGPLKQALGPVLESYPAVPPFDD
jgi:tetratricopeptide (TPR) repeat protein